MTEPDHDGRQIELEQQALARVQQLVSGLATVGDVEEARRWQRQSPAHADAFAFAARLWDGLGPAGRNVLARQDAESQVDRPRMRLALTRRAVFAGAAAASAAYLIARPPLELWPSFSELAADYRTTTGEHRRIALADGGSIELNTQTSIALRDKTGNSDRIELISGEATIATGQEQARTLVVIAGDGSINSRNARFNVRHDGLTSCVTCLEGDVHVERHGDAVMLTAHQQVTYAGRGLGSPVVVDPAAVTAWQDGLLVFQGAPFSDVIAEVNRYRPGRIVLLNADLGRRPVNARFRVGNVDEIMTLAQRVFGAKIRSLPGGLVLVS